MSVPSTEKRCPSSPSAFGGDHGDGVSLRADRRCGAPELERRMRAAPQARQQRHRPLPQKVEVVRFAEEIRLVGRHAIDQMDEFVVQLAAFENRVTVIFDPRQAKGSNSLAQPAFDHRPFARRQTDARVLLHESGQLSEMPFLKLIRHGGTQPFTLRHDDNRHAADGADAFYAADAMSGASLPSNCSRSRTMTNSEPWRPMPTM